MILSRPIALAFSVLSVASLSHAAENEFSRLNDLTQTGVKISSSGKLEADESKWKTEKDGEGTDILSSKAGDESKVALMKSKDGQPESFSSYRLKAHSGAKAESSVTVFFKEGKLTAFTTCEDSAEKDSVGRICVTATPKLCQSLKKSEGIEPETLKEVDLYEMRALAAILTLRGPDHQLENVVKS